MARTPLRIRTSKRLSRITALAASAVLVFALVPAPALADTCNQRSAAAIPAAQSAAESSLVDAFLDSLYLPANTSVNSLRPPESPSGLGALYTASPDDAAPFSTSPLPERYDLRTDGTAGENCVTPVKSQNPWGTCWAFATLSALESSLIMQGAASADPASENYIDLSERFTSYFARTPMPESTLARLGATSQAGEGISPHNMNLFNTGGDALGVANVILSTGGTVAESSAPYRNDEEIIESWEDPELGQSTCYSPDGTWSLNEELRADTKNRVATLKSAEVLPGPYNSYYDENSTLQLGVYDDQNTANVKRSIMENGAIVANYYADTSSPDDQTQETKYFSLENWCQYAYDPITANHVVTIVGWDDDYSRENFPTAPAKDGAWIVKNSWGCADGDIGSTSNWGIDGTGYFYLSYYDRTIYSFVAITADESVNPEPIIQQYDLVDAMEVFTDPLLSTEEISVANVFTAERDMLARSVTVRPSTAGTSATIKVFLLDDNANAPDDGALVAEQTEELSHAGCYVIDLDEPVPVQEGQRYSVVQTIEGERIDPQTGSATPLWSVPIERGIARDLVEQINHPMYFDVVANKGESYFGTSGAWEDTTAFNEDPDIIESGVTYGNVGIKVFGEAATLPDTGTIDIAHTNDIHGHYAVRGADGAAANAFSAVAALAEDEGADIIVDAGDTFHGTSFSTASEGGAIAQLMDAAGYDAMTPGNHDWSYGATRLAEIDAQSGFSVLAANVVVESTAESLFPHATLLREVALQDENGNLTGKSATVGVLGVIDENFYSSTAPGNVSGIVFENAVKAANDAAAGLRAAGAEVVIALTHHEHPREFAAATSGIDAIVAGHEHIAINDAVVAGLRAAGAEVVIALTHHEHPREFAAATSGIDAIVAGHEHIAINDAVVGADGRTVAVVEAASSPQADYFGSIGLLSLEVSDDDSGNAVVRDHEARSFATTDIAVVEAASSPQADYFGSIGLLSLEVSDDDSGNAVVRDHEARSFATTDIARPNKEIDELTAELAAASEEALGRVIGTSGRAYEYPVSSTTAPGGWELLRTQDMPIGHVVTSAYLAQTGADLAFENVGGIRGGIPEGAVTAGDILAVSPYGNTIATYRLTGAHILDTIERSLTLSAACRDVLAKQMAAIEAGEDPLQYRWPDNSGSVLAIGGAVVQIDWNNPDGERVVSISIGGAPLDASRTYTVAMNSFLPQATALYPAFSQAELAHEYGTCEEALRSLIAQPAWEQTMERIFGSVTYVSEGEGGSGGESGGAGEAPGQSGGTDGAGAPSEAGTLSPTSDPLGAMPTTLVFVTALCALTMLIAARRSMR